MQNRMSRVGRIEKVVEIVEQSTVSMTTYQIIKALGMKYSNHAIQIVLDAWRQDRINSCRGEMGNGKHVFYFWSKKMELPHQTALEI